MKGPKQNVPEVSFQKLAPMRHTHALVLSWMLVHLTYSGPAKSTPVYVNGGSSFTQNSGSGGEVGAWLPLLGSPPPLPSSGYPSYNQNGLCFESQRGADLVAVFSTVQMTVSSHRSQIRLRVTQDP